MILLVLAMIIMAIDIIYLNHKIDKFEYIINNVNYINLDDLIEYKEWEKHKDE